MGPLDVERFRSTNLIVEEDTDSTCLSLADLIQFDILCRTVGPGLGMTGVRFMAELILPDFDTDAEDEEVELVEFVEEDEE